MYFRILPEMSGFLAGLDQFNPIQKESIPDLGRKEHKCPHSLLAKVFLMVKHKQLLCTCEWPNLIHDNAGLDQSQSEESILGRKVSKDVALFAPHWNQMMVFVLDAYCTWWNRHTTQEQRTGCNLSSPHWSTSGIPHAARDPFSVSPT